MEILFFILISLPLISPAFKYNSPKVLHQMEKCPKTAHHLKKAEQTPSLHKCVAWNSNACCTPETDKKIQIDGMISLYKFDWNHCAKLSSKCYEFMIKQTCLNECSGIFGAYLKKSKCPENCPLQYKNIPLCNSQCEEWYNACKNDQSCSDEWPNKNFEYIKESTTCTSSCKPFNKLFDNSTHFCEKLFQNTFQVNHDPNQCIYLDPVSLQYEQNFQVAYNYTLLYVKKKEQTYNMIVLILVILTLGSAAFMTYQWVNKHYYSRRMRLDESEFNLL